MNSWKIGDIGICTHPGRMEGVIVEVVSELRGHPTVDYIYHMVDPGFRPDEGTHCQSPMTAITQAHGLSATSNPLYQ